MLTMKDDKTFRAPLKRTSNKWQLTVELLILWREEAITECGSGPSKSSTVDFLMLLKLLKMEKGVLQKVSEAKSEKKFVVQNMAHVSQESDVLEAIQSSIDNKVT
jgi:hypothetical protein